MCTKRKGFGGGFERFRRLGCLIAEEFKKARVEDTPPLITCCLNSYVLRDGNVVFFVERAMG